MPCCLKNCFKITGIRWNGVVGCGKGGGAQAIQAEKGHQQGRQVQCPYPAGSAGKVSRSHRPILAMPPCHSRHCRFSFLSFLSFSFLEFLFILEGKEKVSKGKGRRGKAKGKAKIQKEKLTRIKSHPVQTVQTEPCPSTVHPIQIPLHPKSAAALR